jgi:predicted transcriptional regulator
MDSRPGSIASNSQKGENEITKRNVKMVTAALPKQETESCPVAALAREVKILNESEEKLDLASISLAADAKRENDRLNSRLYDRRVLLQEQASHLLAKSGHGALFQVAMIRDAFDVIEDCLDQESSELRLAKDALKSIDRMAYSLLAFIETITDTKSDEIGVERWMPDRLNPHMQLAKAISGVMEG